MSNHLVSTVTQYIYFLSEKIIRNGIEAPLTFQNQFRRDNSHQAVLGRV